MKQHFKYILIFLLACAGFVFKANAQNVQAVAKLDHDSIKIGEQTKLHLIVHQPAKEKVSFPKLADSLTSKIQIIGSGKLDTVYDPNNRERATVTQTYTVTSFDEGSYNIPSFKLTDLTDTLTTNELNLIVRTVKVDTTKAIYDIKQPLTVSYNLWDWLRDHITGVLVGLGIALAIAGVIYYFKTRPKKEPVVEEVKEIIPLHVEMLNRLQALRDRKLWQQGAVKEYHIELSDLLREYLERRYIIKTQEKTTDEIFAGIKYLDIPDDARNLLRQILILADLVKFAKEKPTPEENNLSIDNAMSFVTKTQLIVKPKEQTEGGKTDELV